MKTPGFLLGAAGLALALAMPGIAQDDGSREAPRGEGRPPHRPPPVIHALDLNHDGALSGEEIARAAESLKALDKNGDGQLTQEELRPPRPEGGGGPGRGDGGRPRPSRDGSGLRQEEGGCQRPHRDGGDRPGLPEGGRRGGPAR